MQPIIDLHCDLLCYMLEMTPPNPNDLGIGAAFPYLKEGNVKLQVMAIFTATGKGSTKEAIKQSEIFKELLATHSNDCYLLHKNQQLEDLESASKIGMIAAIENASGILEEEEPFEKGIERLEEIINNVQRLLYIGFTHHAENRFGGGNNASAGLKEDGRKLLDYLDGKKIAVDFSHASDALAQDILDYIDQNNLDISIIASHSNYRPIWDHCRNLPDRLAKEIINRKGLIGVNFLRAFMNNDDPNAIYDHIKHGIQLRGHNTVCMGADYFNTDDHPDRSRVPFYFPEHENATKYGTILERIEPEYRSKIAFENVKNFLQELWTD